MVFFSLICPHHSETPANLKTTAPSWGFQIFREQTASIYNWYFYNGLSGYCVSVTFHFDIISFHTAHETNKKEQVNVNYNPCHFPRTTEG